MDTSYIRRFFMTCFGSLSHYQVIDLFAFTCIGLLVFLHWPVFAYWNTGLVMGNAVILVFGVCNSVRFIVPVLKSVARKR
jgi:hypothetical protein